MVEEPEPVEQPSRRPPIVILLACAWAVATFFGLGSLADANWEQAARWGYYSPDQVYDGAWWSLITSAFIHVNLVHLLFNLYWIWILGSTFERHFGVINTAVFIVASAFVSSGWEMWIGASGVGLSGVAYAFFGFGWAVRSKVPEFARVVDRQVVMIFLIWGAIAVVLTYLDLFRVGNIAHASGLVFGLLLGGSWSRPQYRIPQGVAAALMVVLAVVPLYWSPMSVDWVSYKANEAMEAERWDEATKLYRRSLEMGQDPAWAWEGLASIYGFQEKKPEYADALQNLRSHSPEAANRIEAEYGEP